MTHKEAIMQPWQIKALELESSGLKHTRSRFDWFHAHSAPYFLIAAIYLLLALPGMGIERGNAT